MAILIISRIQTWHCSMTPSVPFAVTLLPHPVPSKALRITSSPEMPVCGLVFSNCFSPHSVMIPTLHSHPYPPHFESITHTTKAIVGRCLPCVPNGNVFPNRNIVINGGYWVSRWYNIIFHTHTG